MTIYVVRGGKLVDKASLKSQLAMKFAYPCPAVSRMEPFESPITGKEISSWGERDREMREHDCFDPRDLAPGHVYRRGRDVQMKEVEELRADAERTDDTGFEWRDPE